MVALISRGKVLICPRLELDVQFFCFWDSNFYKNPFSFLNESTFCEIVYFHQVLVIGNLLGFGLSQELFSVIHDCLPAMLPFYKIFHQFLLRTVLRNGFLLFLAESYDNRRIKD